MFPFLKIFYVSQEKNFYIINFDFKILILSIDGTRRFSTVTMMFKNIW